MKQTLLISAAICLLGVVLPAAAQNVGDVVECAPTSRSDWRRGVVVENDPAKNYIRVRVEPAAGKTGGVFIVARSDVRQPTGQNDAANQGTAGGAMQAGAAVDAAPFSAGQFVRGTIVENNPALNFMKVKIPAFAGRPAGVYIVGRNDVKPAAGADVPVQPNQPNQPALPNVAAQPNIPAQPNVQQPQQPAPPNQAAPQAPANTPNAKCQCEPQSDVSGAGMDGIFKREIMGVYIINGQDIGSKNPATINFKSFSIGGSRPYRMPEAWAYNTGSPDGPGGREGTVVYPVHARFTVCVDYPGYPKNGYMGRLAVKELDNTYWCFKNATTGKWQCNLGTPSKLLESKYIDK